MRRSLREQIEANKRGSFLYASGIAVLITLLTTLIVGLSAPDYWPYGSIGGVVLSLGCVLVARLMGPKIVLSMSGAREATPIEHRQLQNVVEEMSIAAGIPVPKIYVIDDSAPNAFATGHDPQHGVVAITTGLMQKLNRDELQGVMAHEIAHIRNYDIRYLTTVSLMGGLAALLADVFNAKIRWGFGFRRRDRDQDFSALIFMLIGLVISWVVPLLSMLLRMAVSRQREFLADATAAELTRYPEGLASALQKISSDREPLEVATAATQHMYIINPQRLSGEGSDLFSTHPTTEARIRALMGTSAHYEHVRKHTRVASAPRPNRNEQVRRIPPSSMSD